MAANHYYSNLYTPSAFRGTTVYLPKSASEIKQGGLIAFRFTIAPGTALLNTDVLHLVPNVTAGSFLHDFLLWNDDLDSGTTVTFGLGWTAAPTTYLSASTLFQSANTGTLLTPAQLAAGVTSVAGDELVITLSANSNQVGTVSCMGSIFIP